MTATTVTIAKRTLSGIGVLDCPVPTHYAAVHLLGAAQL